VGDLVRFRMSDVFLPSPESVIAALLGEEEFEGVIIGFSDSGSKSRVFAVVDVVRRQSVVVPLEKLQMVDTSGSGS